MLSSTPSDEARTRRAVLAYLSKHLQPLFPTRVLSAELPGWVAGLPTAALVESLQATPAATADALAAALVGGPAADPADELTFLAAVEYPRLPLARRLRLANFARTVRDLAISGDGTAKAGDLYAAGFSAGEAHELMPRASHLLRLLANGTKPAERLPEADTTPAARLAAYGARAFAAAAPHLAAG